MNPNYPPQADVLPDLTLIFIHSLPFPDFNNFSRFIASDLVSKLSLKIILHGPLFFVNLH